MAQRTRLHDADCPVARALDVIGDWWSLLIVRDAFDGMRRFGEFQRSLGMAKNILAARLRSLVEHGILDAVPAAAGAHREYVLTARGEALFPLIVGLRQWGEHYLYAAGEAHSQLLDRRHGLPLAPLLPRNQKGRPLQAADTEVRKL